MVDLWADWAEPGKPLSAILQRLAAAAGGSWILARVDVDANPRLSQAFGIMSIPTIAYFKPGAQPQGVVGFRPLEQLETAFQLTGLAAPKA